jgi:hypothetical protein
MVQILAEWMVRILAEWMALTDGFPALELWMKESTTDSQPEGSGEIYQIFERQTEGSRVTVP